MWPTLKPVIFKECIIFCRKMVCVWELTLLESSSTIFNVDKLNGQKKRETSDYNSFMQ